MNLSPNFDKKYTQDEGIDLLGVKIKPNTKLSLDTWLDNLSNDSQSGQKTKANLYFLYSEFLLRANRNPYYQKVLNSADKLAIDGKGTLWAMWAVKNPGVLPNLFLKLAFLPTIVLMFLFPLFFGCQLLLNYVISAWQILRKIDYSKTTKQELILGRDFALDILKIAVKKKWQVLIIAGSNNPEAIANGLKNKFPGLQVKVIGLNPKSKTMVDNLGHKFLTDVNLFKQMPELKEVLAKIQKTNFDLIINCIGGESGKQEFFLDYIKKDVKCNYTLAIGVGAAFDAILGLGAKQKQVPSWMVAFGLEWLFRLLTQPYRRKRVLDSVLGLFWFTSIQQFMQNGDLRPTVVNIIQNSKKQFLLVKPYPLLPGDMNWTFVQGGIEKNKDLSLDTLKTDAEIKKQDLDAIKQNVIIQNGLREAREEVGIKPTTITITHQPIVSTQEQMAYSFIRFWWQGARYKTQIKYLNFMFYQGANKLKINWENSTCAWFDKDQVNKNLLLTKRPDWDLACKVIEK